MLFDRDAALMLWKLSLLIDLPHRYKKPHIIPSIKPGRIPLWSFGFNDRQAKGQYLLCPWRYFWGETARIPGRGQTGMNEWMNEWTVTRRQVHLLICKPSLWTPSTTFRCRNSGAGKNLNKKSQSHLKAQFLLLNIYQVPTFITRFWGSLLSRSLWSKTYWSIQIPYTWTKVSQTMCVRWRKPTQVCECVKGRDTEAETERQRGTHPRTQRKKNLTDFPVAKHAHVPEMKAWQRRRWLWKRDVLKKRCVLKLGF